MSGFIATGKLDMLSEEEKKQHYLNVCQSLGLDPKAGLLRYEMMDDGTGTGLKHLVLYATKGATDRLRDIHGIDVIEMTDKIAGGAITFIAKGRNKAGRIDIAVGSATLEGLRGKAIGYAFMASQTRASRRLTLQMAGAGLLDESEINDGQNGTVAIENAPQPLSEIGQPVEVSGAPGADITGTALKMPPAVPKMPAKATPEPAPASIAGLPSPETKPLPNPAAGLKPLPINSMASPHGVKPSAAVVEFQTTQQPPVTLPPNSGSVLRVVAAPPEVPAPEKTRRRRRTKAEMAAARAAETATVSANGGNPESQQSSTLESSTSAVVSADASVVDAGVSVATATPEIRAAAAPEEPREAPSTSPVDTPSVSQAPSEKSSTVVGDLPNADQMKAFVERLTVYRNDVLPKGGMVPSHGMGVNKKVREFFKVACPGTEDLKALTVNQWETVLNFMDKTVTEHGPRKLVEIMEYNIGATDEPTNG